MLTPLDIESKVFSKSVPGYNISEVKAFMKDLLTHYEKMYKENIELKDKLNVVNEGIQYYKNIEETLQHTLILAEKMAEETKNLARQKADHIEKEAQLKAEVMVNEARQEVRKITHIREELIQSYSANQIQIKQFLKAQLELTERLDFDLHSSSHLYENLFASGAENQTNEKIVEAAEETLSADSLGEEATSDSTAELSTAAVDEIADQTAVLFES